MYKTGFHDVVAVRYGWDFFSTVLVMLGFLLNIHFLVGGGFPTIRHNEIRDLTANVQKEVCHEVQVEQGLQPNSGKQFQQASLNIEDGACIITPPLSEQL